MEEEDGGGKEGGSLMKGEREGDEPGAVASRRYDTSLHRAASPPCLHAADFH